MSTQIETVHLALAAKLAALAVSSGAFTFEGRQDARRVEELESGVALHQMDAAADIDDQELGGDYEMYVVARLQLIAADDAALAELDAAVVVIRDALMADDTLGGVVDDLELTPRQAAEPSIFGGAPLHQGCSFTVRMLITASSPLG